MRLKQIAILSTILMTTSGCSTIRDIWNPPVKIETITKTVERKIVQPTMPRALDLKEPGWIVVSAINIREFEKFVIDENMAMFAMTADDYEIMASNMQEIKRYITQMKQVIVYYRNVTTTPEKKEDGGTGAEDSNL